MTTHFCCLWGQLHGYLYSKSCEYPGNLMKHESSFSKNRNVIIVQIPFQLGVSKSDLRKVIKSSLSGVDKSITAMYKKMQKNVTSEELLPSLWDKCKTEFLDKYTVFAQLVTKVYPAENIPAVAEMRDLLASM